jgi:hypothetical protein
MFTYYDEKSNRLRDNATGRFAPFNPAPDETCPNGCERYGDWWVPEDCPTHLLDRPGGGR